MTSGLHEIFGTAPAPYTPTLTAKLPKPPTPPATKTPTPATPTSVGITPKTLAIGIGIPAALMAVVAAVQYLPWWLCLILLAAAVTTVLLLILKNRKKRKPGAARRMLRPRLPLGARHPTGRPTGRFPSPRSLLNRIKPNRMGRAARNGTSHRTPGHNKTKTQAKGRFPFNNPFGNKHKNKTGSPHGPGHPHKTPKRPPFRNPFARKPKGHPTGHPTGRPKGAPKGKRQRWPHTNKNNPPGHKNKKQPTNKKNSWNPFGNKPNKPNKKPPTRKNQHNYNPPNRPNQPTKTPHHNRDKDKDKDKTTWAATDGIRPETTVHDSDWYSTTKNPTWGHHAGTTQQNPVHAWGERLDQPTKMTKQQDGQPRPPAQNPEEIPMTPPALPPVQPPEPNPYTQQIRDEKGQFQPHPHTTQPKEKQPAHQIVNKIHVFTPDHTWDQHTPDPVAHNGAYSYEQWAAATTSQNIKKGMQMHPVEQQYADKIASTPKTYSGLAQSLTAIAKEARLHAQQDHDAAQKAALERQAALAQGHDVTELEKYIRELNESHQVRSDLAAGCERRAQEIIENRIPASA